MIPNYYAVLGIDSNSSIDQIKSAYRKLAHIWHPDKNSSSNAKEKFIEIHEAFEILSDPIERNLYDELIQQSRSNYPVKFEEALKSKESKFNEASYNARQKASFYSNHSFQVLYNDILKVLDQTVTGCSIFLAGGFAIWLVFCGIMALVRTFEFDKGHDTSWFILVPLAGISFIFIGYKMIMSLIKKVD